MPKRNYTPRVRVLARELDVDLDTIEGTGAEGRITMGDVQRAARERDRAAAEDDPAGDSASESAEEHRERIATLAEELGVDLTQVAGTGPPEQPITVDDVMDAALASGGRDASESGSGREEAETAASAHEPAASAPPGAEPDAEPPSPPPSSDESEAAVAASTSTPQQGGHELSGYAERLDSAGAASLASVIRAYVGRVEGVLAGRLHPSAAAVPSSIDPAMVGKRLAAKETARFLEAGLEFLRNILIFVPVLLTWIKIQRDGKEIQEQGLVELKDTAELVVIFVIALIAAHVLLGVVRQRRGAKADRIAGEFAAAVASASMEVSTRQVASTEEAIAEFAAAGRGLTASMQDAGASLADTGRVMDEMREMLKQQGQRLDDLMNLLKPISEIGDQLSAAQRDLSMAAASMGVTSRTLGEIQQHLAPAAERLAETVQRLNDLAQHLGTTSEQLGRMTEGFAENVQPIHTSAAEFGEAVSQLNLVAQRVADALEAVQQARDGRGRRYSE